MEERFYIPRTLDDPPLFFMWALDDAAVFLCGIILFSLMGSALMFLVGCATGLAAARGYARLKQAGGKGFVVRALYWYSPSDWWFRSPAPSHVREYIGG